MTLQKLDTFGIIFSQAGTAAFWFYHFRQLKWDILKDKNVDGSSTVSCLNCVQ